MENKQLEALYNFMRLELSLMRESVKNNYADNIKNRKSNVFLAFSDESINKYMALSRSVDSQLGNRMQRIIFYAARLRYGKLNVPNILSIDILNEADRNIRVTVYSVPCDLNKSDQKAGFNPYCQFVTVSQNLSVDKVKRMLKIKNKSNKLLYQSYEFKLSQDSFNIIKKSKKKIPVDLLLLYIGEDTIFKAIAFEIKMGGNLDTKNAKSNAQEVKNLSELFSFLDVSTAYFATCYGKCSAAVETELNTILNNKSILNGIEFWQKILPDSFTFDEFIDAYKKAFIESALEKELKSLK